MRKRSNILMIVTDQMRMDLLKCYDPGSRCRTPNLDRLASESVVFDNNYTVCAVCTPTRATFQTGLKPSGHGMLTNTYNDGCSVHELADSPQLLSSRLLGEGYSVGYTGKWHLGEGQQPEDFDTGRWPDFYRKSGGTLPSNVGYEADDFPGHGSGGYWYPQYEQYLKDNGLELKINEPLENRPWHTHWGEIASSQESTMEHFLVNRTIDFIDQFKERENPFCMQLHIWGPHEPFYAPTRFLEEYRDVEFPMPVSFRGDEAGKPRHHGVWRRTDKEWEFFQNSWRHYCAFMTSIDHELGRLFDYLKAEGIYEDTVIVFTADHGDSQGCHGGIENKGLHMYEEVMHIPLLIKPSGGCSSQQRVSAFTGSCDIYSTILHLAGIALKNCERDGRSLTGFLDGTADSDHFDHVVSEGHGLAGVLFSQRMIRMRNWKYIFNISGQDELYDLDKDPHELQNRIDEQNCVDIRKELQQVLLKNMERSGDALTHTYRHLVWGEGMV